MIRYVTFALCLILLSCGEDLTEKQYEIKKLRTIGVGKDKIAYTYSPEDNYQSAQLTFYLATPVKEDPQFEEITLEKEVQIPLSIGEVSFDEFAKFRIYKIAAIVQIPKLSELPVNVDATGNFFSYKYAVRISQNGEEELIKGEFRVFPANDSRLSLPLPKVKIISPAGQTAANSDPIKLAAVIENNDSDKYRVAWNISSGKIDRTFRSLEVEWLEAEAGVQSVLVSIRSLDTRFFAYDVADITIGEGKTSE